MRRLLLLIALPLAACATPATNDSAADSPMRVTVTVKPPVSRPGLPPLVPLAGLDRAASLAPGSSSVSGGPGR